MNYEPRWDLDFRRGQRGENIVRSVVEGMMAGTVEVKTDDAAVQTGRVYVEHACRKQGMWTHSGIATSQADFWVFVVGEMLLGLPTDVLRALHATQLQAGRGLMECSRGSHPTKGVVLPIRMIVDTVRTLATKQAS